jgi:hypothetical protein
VEDNADVTRQWGCGAVARWWWRNGWRRRSGGQRGCGADAGLRRGGSAAWRIGKFFDGHGGTGHIHALSLTLFLILLTLLLVLLYRRRGGADQRGRARWWGFVGVLGPGACRRSLLVAVLLNGGGGGAAALLLLLLLLLLVLLFFLLLLLPINGGGLDWH